MSKTREKYGEDIRDVINSRMPHSVMTTERCTDTAVTSQLTVRECLLGSMLGRIWPSCFTYLFALGSGEGGWWWSPGMAHKGFVNEDRSHRCCCFRLEGVRSFDYYPSNMTRAALIRSGVQVL